MKKLSPNLTNWTPRRHAVLGVFDCPAAAEKTAAALRADGVEVRQIRQASELPPIVYYPLEEIGMKRIVEGVSAGAAFGLLMGMIWMATFDLEIASLISLVVVGAIIGGAVVAGRRSSLIHLPDPGDYVKMLAEGKSLLSIRGSQIERIEYAARIQGLGASEVYHHPPFQLLRQHPSELTSKTGSAKMVQQPKQGDLMSNLN